MSTTTPHSESKFQQDTKSINSFLFTNPVLSSHSFILSNIYIQKLIASSGNADSDTSRTRRPSTSNFILRRAFSPLKTFKSQNISNLYYELERSRRVLSSTGIFKEIKVELEDDDLTGEKLWDAYIKEKLNHQTEHTEHTSEQMQLNENKNNLMNDVKSRLDHQYFMNARITAIEKPSRATMGLGMSMTMDGDSEINFSTSYRNLLRLADVVSLNISGANSSFNELLQPNSQISWKNALLSPKIMIGASWRFPFLIGEILTFRGRIGAETIHETLLNHKVNAFDLHTQINPNNSLEYSIEKRELLLGGNVEQSLELLGGGYSSLRSSMKHIYTNSKIKRDEAGFPTKGISFRLENSVSGTLKVGNAKHVRSQLETSLFFPLLKQYIIGSIHTKVGAVASFDAISRVQNTLFNRSSEQNENTSIQELTVEKQAERNIDELNSIYIADRIFTQQRGFNQVGQIAYIEQMKNGNTYIDDYQSKGGNVAFSLDARAIIPFRHIPYLNTLSMLYFHTFIGFSNSLAYDFQHIPTVKEAFGGVYSSYGAGVFIPLGSSARLEFNYNAPLYRPEDENGASKNFQKIQMKFFFEV